MSTSSNGKGNKATTTSDRRSQGNVVASVDLERNISTLSIEEIVEKRKELEGEIVITKEISRVGELRGSKAVLSGNSPE